MDLAFSGTSRQGEESGVLGNRDALVWYEHQCKPDSRYGTDCNDVATVILPRLVAVPPPRAHEGPYGPGVRRGHRRAGESHRWSIARPFGSE